MDVVFDCPQAAERHIPLHGPLSMQGVLPGVRLFSFSGLVIAGMLDIGLQEVLRAPDGG